MDKGTNQVKYKYYNSAGQHVNMGPLKALI